jgi:hypothetical protein
MYVQKIEVQPRTIRPGEQVAVIAEAHNPSSRANTAVVPVRMSSQDMINDSYLLSNVVLEMAPQETCSLLLETVTILRPGSWTVKVFDHESGIDVVPDPPDISVAAVSAACSNMAERHFKNVSVRYATDLHAGRVSRLNVLCDSKARTLIAKSYKGAPAGVFARDCAPYELLSQVSYHFPGCFIDGESQVLYLEDLGEPLWPRLTKVDSDTLMDLFLVVEGLADLHATNISHVPSPFVRRVSLVEQTHLRWIDPIKVLAQMSSGDSSGHDEQLSKSWHAEVLRLEKEFGLADEVLIHTDFHLGNLFLANGRIKVIDMPGINIGAAEIDLAKLLSRLIGIKWPEILYLVDRYLKVRRCYPRDQTDSKFLNRFSLRWVMESIMYIANSLTLRARPWAFHSSNLAIGLAEVTDLCAQITTALRANPAFTHLLGAWTALTHGGSCSDSHRPLNFANLSPTKLAQRL